MLVPVDVMIASSRSVTSDAAALRIMAACAPAESRWNSLPSAARAKEMAGEVPGRASHESGISLLDELGDSVDRRGDRHQAAHHRLAHGDSLRILSRRDENDAMV